MDSFFLPSGTVVSGRKFKHFVNLLKHMLKNEEIEKLQGLYNLMNARRSKCSQNTIELLMEDNLCDGQGKISAELMPILDFALHIEDNIILIAKTLPVIQRNTELTDIVRTLTPYELREIAYALREGRFTTRTPGYSKLEKYLENGYRLPADLNAAITVTSQYRKVEPFRQSSSSW
jgi:hypothetical protein